MASFSGTPLVLAMHSVCLALDQIVVSFLATSLVLAMHSVCLALN